MAGKKFGELNPVTTGKSDDLYAIRQDKGGGVMETRKITGAQLAEWIKSQLGTAALANTGSDANEVPKNSNLGTASTKTAVVDNLDTTTGRVPVVGWMGLGASSGSILPDVSVGSPTPYVPNGVWRGTGSTTGRPPGASTTAMLSLRNSTTTGALLAVNPTDKTMHVNYQATTWGATWFEVMTTGRKADNATAITGTDDEVYLTPKSGKAARDAAISALNLGTASTKTAVENATDVTAGRVVTVGTYGLGIPITLTRDDDLDNVLTLGTYAHTAGNAPVGVPGIGGAGTLTVARGTNAAWVQQEWSRRDTVLVYRRLIQNGAPSPWERVLTDGMKATKSQAEAGIDSTVYMTPLAVKQAIDLQVTIPLGQGQSWVVASRAKDVAYQNTFGRTICIYGHSNSNVSGRDGYVHVSANGSDWITFSTFMFGSLTIPVPPMHYYKWSGYIDNFRELR